MNHYPLIASLCLLSSLSLPTQANEVRYNQISLRAEVSQDVAHDRMFVTLYSEAQNKDPVALAKQLSETLNQAVTQARTVKDVSVSTGGRRSSPIYSEDGKKILTWRERVELQLESSNFAALSQLSAELLSSMNMASMSFSLAEESRKKVEDDLLQKSIKAFQQRATIASQALGASDYKIVNLNLNSSGGYFAPPMRMMAMAAKASAEDMPAQEIEAGSSRISMSADGTIEVSMP